MNQDDTNDVIDTNDVVINTIPSLLANTIKGMAENDRFNFIKECMRVTKMCVVTSTPPLKQKNNFSINSEEIVRYLANDPDIPNILITDTFVQKFYDILYEIAIRTDGGDCPYDPQFCLWIENYHSEIETPAERKASNNRWRTQFEKEFWKSRKTKHWLVLCHDPDANCKRDLNKKALCCPTLYDLLFDVGPSYQVFKEYWLVKYKDYDQ